MVFGRLIRAPASSKATSSAVARASKASDDEAEWSEVQDLHAQHLATAVTTDEEESAQASRDRSDEGAWDWALEGDSPRVSADADAWVVDEYLVPKVIQDDSPKTEPGNTSLSTDEEKEDPAPSHECREPAGEPEEAPNYEPLLMSLLPPPPPVAPIEEPGYRCSGCGTHIFRDCDILSSNYQAMTGPGYLIAKTCNTESSSNTQTVTYTTGVYKICEVSCENCLAKLGITYLVAPDVKNEYKVGKYLIGADRLVLPDGVIHPKEKSKQ